MHEPPNKNSFQSVEGVPTSSSVHHNTIIPFPLSPFRVPGGVQPVWLPWRRQDPAEPGGRVPPCAGPEPHRVRCAQVHAPAEGGRAHLLRGVPAHLPGHLQVPVLGHGRRLYRGTASLRQGRQRLHLLCWAAPPVDYAGREADGWRGGAAVDEPGGLAGQRELRGVCAHGHGGIGGQGWWRNWIYFIGRGGVKGRRRRNANRTTYIQKHTLIKVGLDRERSK